MIVIAIDITMAAVKISKIAEKQHYDLLGFENKISMLIVHVIIIIKLKIKYLFDKNPPFSPCQRCQNYTRVSLMISH